MVLSLGEILLRLSTISNEKLEQAASFNAVYGGSEANVLIGLGLLGIPGRFITRLPDNPMGTAALRKLNEHGIDTAPVTRGGNRMAIYFLEQGAALRSGKIVYDRKNASVNSLVSEDIDWEGVFSGIKWVHWSGITPALSENAASVCRRLVDEAAARDLPVSCDLHYRTSLWDYGKQAHEIIPELLSKTSCLVGDPNAIRQTTHSEAVPLKGFLSQEQLMENFAETMHEFPNIKSISMLSRKIRGASDNELTGIMYNGNEFTSGPYRVRPIIDRVGGGDAFMTGIIHGQLSGKSEQETVEWATALSAYKHTIPGDQLVGSREDFESCMGDEPGKLNR